MPGVLMIAAAEIARPEGDVTKIIMTVMIAMGLLMGLVLTTKIAKEWSRG
ncbi:MAG: hypothetical protein KF757_09915 [Phycisphaeraceae bacterium]|nr:hypothetical protein [Phycisphaeraceae bacterium]MCW5763528.1 hypothetical protein [Phycisphaeraceae bacterium]